MQKAEKRTCLHPCVKRQSSRFRVRKPDAHAKTGSPRYAAAEPVFCFKCEQTPFCQLSICRPRKPATVCTSFCSDSPSGALPPSSRSITQPIRSPSDKIGAATPR